MKQSSLFLVALKRIPVWKNSPNHTGLWMSEVASFDFPPKTLIAITEGSDSKLLGKSSFTFLKAIHDFRWRWFKRCNHRG